MKGTPTGVLDAYYRDICVGDTIRDISGRLYIAEDRGLAKPMNGAGSVAIRSLKEVEVVDAFATRPAPTVNDKPAPPPRHIPSRPSAFTAQPKPAPTKKERPVQLIRQDAPFEKAKPKRIQPPPEEDGSRSKRPGVGGRPNKSGLSRLSKVCNNMGFRVPDARPLLAEAGIGIVRYKEQYYLTVADAAKARDLLSRHTPPAPPVQAAKPKRERPQRTLPRGHRQNRSGLLRFDNLGRRLGRTARELKALALANGFDIVSTSHAYAIRAVDEQRFVELVSVTPVSDPLLAAVRDFTATADQYLICRASRTLFVRKLETIKQLSQ